MERPIRIDEGEETMADSTARTRPGTGRKASPEGDPDTERERRELPEWLARELFKIFV